MVECKWKDCERRLRTGDHEQRVAGASRLAWEQAVLQTETVTGTVCCTARVFL